MDGADGGRSTFIRISDRSSVKVVIYKVVGADGGRPTFIGISKVSSVMYSGHV